MQTIDRACVQVRGAQFAAAAPPSVIVAADGESSAAVAGDVKAGAASAAPMKVEMDASGRPVTILEVINEVEVSQQ